MRVFQLRSSAVFLVLSFVLLSCTLPVLAAEEERPTASLSTDFLNQYVFRGIAFSNDSLVIQPSMTVGYKGFSANVWGNFDTDEDFSNKGANWNETDFTLSYSREIYCGLSGTVGGILYSVDGIDDSFEVFGGLSYAFPWVTVSFNAYREVSHFPGWWLQLDVSRSFELPWYGMSLALTASAGYQHSDDVGTNPPGETGEYSALHSGQFMSALNIPVAKYFTVSPKLGVVFPLSSEGSDRIGALSVDGDEVHLVGGINLTLAF
jgi:uncharacterized protein (TIGR02001 family)